MALASSNVQVMGEENVLSTRALTLKKMVDLTLNELKKYDGKNGKPAYFACGGIIYDVSDSTWFTDGEHMVAHFCGRDLTEELKKAPHGDDYFFDIKKVGKLIASDQ